MDEDQSAARFLAVVEEIEKTAPVALDATGAALIAAIYFGIGSDSRSLSNKLGIAHAIVLRSISSLSGRLLTVAKRDTRTQRTFLELTDEGKALAHSASDVPIDRTSSTS